MVPFSSRVTPGLRCNRHRLVPALLLIGALLAWTLPVAAVPFTFTKIAESFALDIVDAPAMNSSGQVAFQASLNGQHGIYVGSGGALLTIALNSNVPFGGITAPSINDAGQVAFRATSSILSGNGGALTTIFSSSGPTPGLASINNSGIVAFSTGTAIFTGNGGPLTQLYGQSALFNSFSTRVLTLNDNGQVAFVAGLNTNFGPGIQGVFRGDGGPATKIVSETDPGFTNMAALNDHAVINNGGTVAFTGFHDSFVDGVFVGNGGAVTTVADASSPVFGGQWSEGVAPSINSAGIVAFLAPLQQGGSGIFTSEDLVNAVIKQGDSLFGSTVSAVHMTREALNDNGHIAFRYQLANGRGGIARADPVVSDPGQLPEPASLTLFGLGLAGLAFSRRKGCGKRR